MNEIDTFTDNKYSRWYYSIIRLAINRSKPEGYTERHHIVPKSLGGTNDDGNIVVVTAREHFVLHLLLTRMTSGESKGKMIHAAWNLCQKTKPGRDYRVSSRIYQHLRLEHSAIASSTMKGRLKSPETRERMRTAALNRTPEHRMRKSLAQIGRKLSPETRAKISQKAKERKQPEGWTTKGMHWWNDGRDSRLSRERPGPDWSPGRLLAPKDRT